MSRILYFMQMVMLIIAWLIINIVASTKSVPLPSYIPRPENNLMPDKPTPQGISCQQSMYLYSDDLYCNYDEQTMVVVKNQRIKRTFLFLQTSELTVGQLIDQWGEPIGANYRMSSR